MVLQKRSLFRNPWDLIRFFIPIVALITGSVYALTFFRHIYPGIPALLTATAAGLCEPENLIRPLFGSLIRLVADLPIATLPIRLNLFCACCGMLAATLFYLLTARLIYTFSAENPGGSLSALPPLSLALRDKKDLAETDPHAFSVNSDGSLAIPVSVQAHNWRSAYAAVLGGVGSTLVLIFCGPFWLVATRLFPFAFELALFFLLLNLLIAYDQRGHPFNLFASAFLLAFCCVESPIFLVLLPIGGGVLLRSMILNEHATVARTLAVILTGLIGFLLAGSTLWHAAEICAAIPIPAPRPILSLFLKGMLEELIRWIPSFGWSYTFMQVLLPCAIGLFVFAFSFRKRTPLLFLIQLVLVILLLPSLLNLRISPWAIARLTSHIPIYSYTLLAFMTGLLLAVWHLMREMFEEQISDDLDYYEYRDNPIVCRIGSRLCWLLLAIICAVPFRSYKDINPREGAFVDALTDEVYQALGSCDWIVNSELLTHHLMLRANQDKRELRFVSTTDMPNQRHAPLRDYIHDDPSFATYQARLQNAADLSEKAFLREWLRLDPHAYERIAFFKSADFLRKYDFTPCPETIFFKGLPKQLPLQLDALLMRHRQVLESMRPYLFPEQPDSIKLFATIRQAMRSQLALIGNELGVLLAEENRNKEAADIFEQSETLTSHNLSILLNRYQLAFNRQIRPELLPELEARLREIPRSYTDTHLFTPASVQATSGHLIEPGILEQVRKSFWGRSGIMQQLADSLTPNHRIDPLLALHDKRRDLVKTITLNIDRYNLETANLQLDLLLDLDDKDHFALINKARIAIERRNLPEAGLWLDLAKESGVIEDELTWHRTALMIINGDLDQARTILNTAISRNPSDIELWGLLAEILLQQQDYHDLETRVFPVLRSATTKKGNAMLYMVRGYLLKHADPKNLLPVRANFLRAIDCNPNLTNLREEVLRLDADLNVPAFSEEDAKAMLRQNPDHAFANYLWGRVRLERGELDLAEDLFKRSLEAEKINGPACGGLGEVLLAQESYAYAEKFLRLALTYIPDQATTRHALARLLLATNRINEAAREIEPVFQASPENPSVQLTVIKIRLAQRNYKDAAEMLSALLADQRRLPRHIVSQLRPLSKQLFSEMSQ